MRRTPLVWVIFIAAVLAAPATAADADAFERKNAYRAVLQDLPVLQNPDGGFGRPVDGANGTAPTTAPTLDSYLETIFTTSLLLAEGTDPYTSWTTYNGTAGSLAASNVTSALDWLRGHEARADAALRPGDHALVALAYQPLGDSGNADRVLAAILDVETAAPGTLDAVDAAQVVFVLAHSGLATTPEHNDTIAALHEQVRTHPYHTLEGQAWALLAQPDHAAHAATLTESVTTTHATSKHGLALAAWALSASAYTQSDAESLLSRLYDSAPTGAARVFYLLGERTADPTFSPHAPADILARGTTLLPVGARSPDATPAQGAAPPITVEDDPATSDSSRFPLPTWIMAGIILVALSALIVVGLAYGLKREDLNGPRREIFNYIETNPGAHFSQIRRELGYAPGTFQHHLSILESEGWITSHKEARYKRYFVNGNRYQKMIAGYAYKQKFAAIANDTTRTFVRYVQDHPGATQKMVAARLNLHASTVNWHAKRLKQAGILRDERVGKEVRYTVDDGAVSKMMKVAEERDEMMATAAS